jgi:DNA-binding XRE family transcriptional regulator
MIERMRCALGLSQAGLARKLKVSAMAVSRWERGINEPSSSIYVQLGKMAGSADCWYFWGLAGMTRQDVEKALQASTEQEQVVATR